MVFSISYFNSHKAGGSKEYFFLGNREIDGNQASFSIAASWIWAPALLVSGTKAYTQGLIGLFWFTVPNVLSLIMFGYLAVHLRKKFSKGFSLVEYIRKQTSERVKNVYLFQILGLTVAGFAVQLLAGGKIVELFTGLNFTLVTAVMIFIAISYSLFSGINASILTDYLQMGIIIVTLFLVVPYIISKTGFTAIAEGIGGPEGEFLNIFGDNGKQIAWAFGIPATIGLLSGPMGDQSYWQRAFSIKEGQVKKSFIKGGLIFAVVPVLLGILGFIARGTGIEITDVGIVNAEIGFEFLPVLLLIPFAYMFISGLVSTLDSHFCALSSIIGHDILEEKFGISEAKSVKYSKYSMIVLAFLGFIIANFPGITIFHLWLFYGTFRATTLLPSIINIFAEGVKEKYVFYGLLGSFIIGLPPFIYGNYFGIPNLVVLGSLLTVSISGILTGIGVWKYAGTQKTNSR